MADRNDKLNGNNYTEEGLKPVDINDTNDTIIDLASIGICQNAYQILQANNVFENKDNLLADEFIDSNGTNNTVNTGSSTSIHNADESSFQFPLTEDVLSGDTTHNPDSFTNPSNAFNWDDNDFAQKTKIASSGDSWTFENWKLGKTFTAKTILGIQYDIDFNLSGIGFDGDLFLQTYDGVSWSTVYTIVSDASSSANYTGIYILNSSVQGVRVAADISNGSTSSARTGTVNVNILGYATTYQTEKTLIIDSSTLTLDGTEKSLCIYTDATFPSNTSLTVTASDGTTSTSAQTINTSSKSTGLFNIGSLSSGTLELTFTLSSTDNTNSPRFRGYGGYMLR